jgi:SAM-dependent methyltransferase
MSTQPLMYTDIAEWWPLISKPEEYAEEAGIFSDVIFSFFPGTGPLRSRLRVLELGSGGGNNASHMKANFDLTLVDLSPHMLAVSLKLNPDLPHHLGDMRSVRLEQTFDAVFIHDAVDYMTSEDDLRALLQTVRAHLRPGGLVLLCPDDTRETFQEKTSTGGHDGQGRSLRYLEWTYDPDPADTTAIVDFTYLLREGQQQVRALYDRHIFGLFPRDTWLRLLQEAGFNAETRPFDHSEVEGVTEMFVGTLNNSV